MGATWRRYFFESAKRLSDLVAQQIAHLIRNADVASDAAIAESKLALTYGTASLNTAIGTKADASALSSHAGNTNNPHATTAAQVGAVESNTAITGATKTKITYDSKGLVTAGDDATAADVGAVAVNASITPGTGTKLTVDAKGLVTVVGTATAADVGAEDSGSVATHAALATGVHGLGGASQLNVGTTTGTVAAGDHGHAHSALSGLTTGNDHTQYVLREGKALGQVITGGTGSAEALAFHSTMHGTKGNIEIGQYGAHAILSVLEEDGEVALPQLTAGKPLMLDSYQMIIAQDIPAANVSGLGGAAMLSVGATAGTVAAGDDSRFHSRAHDMVTSADHQAAAAGDKDKYLHSNASTGTIEWVAGATPSAHASTHNAGGSDALAIDAAAGTGSLRTLGTSSTSAAPGNHTHAAAAPAAHASTHNAGGSDALAIDAAAGTGSLRTLGTSATSAAAGNHAHTLPVTTEMQYGKWLDSYDAATGQFTATTPTYSQIGAAGAGHKHGMTAPYDMIVGAYAGAPDRLAGPTVDGTYWLKSVASGGATTGVSWSALAKADVGLGNVTNDAQAKAGAVTGSGLTIATAKVLGRLTAGTGAIEELDVATTATANAVWQVNASNQAALGYGSALTWNDVAGNAGANRLGVSNDATHLDFRYRAASGMLRFYANSSTAGSGGESQVAQFEYNKATIYQPLTLSGPITQAVSGTASVANSYLVASLASGNDVYGIVGRADTTDQSLRWGHHYDSTAASSYGYLSIGGEAASTGGLTLQRAGHVGIGQAPDTSYSLACVGAVKATGVNVTGLTASRIVATDAINNLVSLAYSSTGAASSLVQTDGELYASRALATTASGALHSLSAASTTARGSDLYCSTSSWVEHASVGMLAGTWLLIADYGGGSDVDATMGIRMVHWTDGVVPNSTAYFGLNAGSSTCFSRSVIVSDTETFSVAVQVFASIGSNHVGYSDASCSIKAIQLY